MSAKNTAGIQETFKWTNTWNQYFATITVNLIMFSHGTAMGWTSPAFPILSSAEKTPLASGPLTNDDISWIGSINSFGAFCGTLSLGYFISRMGSKRAILLITIPEVAYWILIYFGDHYNYILIARFLNGYAGGGILTSLVLYISEIANDDIRGRLAACVMFFRNLGILVAYILGATVSYFTVPIISIVIPLVFLIIFLMLPNTPQYHLQRGHDRKAESALKFYKGYKGSSKQEDDAIFEEFERLKSIASERKIAEKVQASDFWSRDALKGFTIGFAIIAFVQLTANFTIVSYAVTIFERTETPIDPYVSSIIMAFALISGSLLTTYFADIFGRRVLNIVSLAGSAFGLFAVSLHHYLHIEGYDLTAFTWVPVVSVSFVVFISSAGIVGICYVTSIEVLPSKVWTNYRNQYYAAIAVNLIAFCQGLNLGWISPAVSTLSSNSTPLSSGPLTNDQVSWIGSVNCMAGLIGSLSFGYFTVRMGSKRVLLFLSIPAILAWLIIHFGYTYHHILIARSLAGWMGGGVQSTVVLFIAEISNDEIRGRLGSLTSFLRHLGILIEFILGATLEYHYIPYISVVVPITFFISFMLIPNTPRYYLHRGQVQKAQDSLIFYKGCKKSKQRDYGAICNELERLQMVISEQKDDERFHFPDFCNRGALKGLFIGIILTTIACFTANLSLTSYTVMTVAKVGTYIDPHISSIMVAVALLFGSLISTYLADRWGRRKLNLCSIMGSACGLLATAMYYYFNSMGYDLSAFAWVPVVSLSFVIFISSAGIVTLSVLCSVECLPPKVRTYGMAIISCSYSFVNFVCVKIYPILLESIDLHGCLACFGIACIFGFVFVLFFVRETSNQSLDFDVAEKTEIKRRCMNRLDSYAERKIIQ